MTEARETLFASLRQRSSSLTVEQAAWLMRHAERGEIAAFSAGLGSNGYPAGEDAWFMLTDSRSGFLTPEGEARWSS